MNDAKETKEFGFKIHKLPTELHDQTEITKKLDFTPQVRYQYPTGLIF